MIKDILSELIEKDGRRIPEIARQAGLDRGTLYRICDGRTRSMELRTAFRLADALGVDVNEFRKGVED